MHCPHKLTSALVQLRAQHERQKVAADTVRGCRCAKAEDGLTEAFGRVRWLHRNGRGRRVFAVHVSAGLDSYRRRSRCYVGLTPLGGRCLSWTRFGTLLPCTHHFAHLSLVLASSMTAQQACHVLDLRYACLARHSQILAKNWLSVPRLQLCSSNIKLHNKGNGCTSHLQGWKQQVYCGWQAAWACCPLARALPQLALAARQPLPGACQMRPPAAPEAWG